MTEPAQQPRSWMARNCLWLVPVGCLGLLALGAAFLGGALTLAMGGIKSTDAYREALARARSSPEVRAALGEPITAGWFVQGKVNVSGPTGDADLSIPLSGPRGKGTLYLTARKQSGRWEYEVLQVAVEGRQDRIDLLPGSG
jgi:hypothetical protein